VIEISMKRRRHVVGYSKKNTKLGKCQ